MKLDRFSSIYLLLLVLAVVTSLLVSAERYLIQKEFTFFVSESDIPHRFDIHSYLP